MFFPQQCFPVSWSILLTSTSPRRLWAVAECVAHRNAILQVQKLVFESILRLTWTTKSLHQLPTIFVHKFLLAVYLLPSLSKGGSPLRRSCNA